MSGARSAWFDGTFAPDRMMREAGAEPLDPYPGPSKRWRCRCQSCGAEISPTFRAVERGGSPCSSCAPSTQQPPTSPCRTAPSTTRAPRSGRPQLFVSHAGTDRAHAERLIAELESRQTPVSVAFRDVPPGADYAAWIVGEIRRCRNFVLLLSPASTQSRHCLRELEIAIEERSTIIPIWIIPHTIPDGVRYRLAGCQYFDLEQAASVLVGNRL